MSVREKIKLARNEIKKARYKSIARTEELLDSMFGISLNAKTQRGLLAEVKALKATKYWAGLGIIRRTKLNKRLSSEDMSGVDLVLTLLDGRKIKVQVKNYSNFTVFKKSREQGTIPFIVWPDDGEDIAKERMLNLIMSAYIANLNPIQIRDALKYILKLNKPQGLSLMGKFFSRFRKAS